MAETALEKLKRLKKERLESKKTEEKQDVPVVVPEVSPMVQASNIKDTEKEEETITPAGAKDTTPLQMKLAELQQALDNKLDNFPYLLQYVWRQVSNDPEQCILLTDEEIGIIVRGIETHAGATIVQEGKKKSKSAKTQPTTIDMLI